MYVGVTCVGGNVEMPVSMLIAKALQNLYEMYAQIAYYHSITYVAVLHTYTYM